MYITLNILSHGKPISLFTCCTFFKNLDLDRHTYQIQQTTPVKMLTRCNELFIVPLMCMPPFTKQKRNEFKKLNGKDKPVLFP